MPISARAAREGIALCPNFILSRSDLSVGDRDLYTAHELARMLPIAGMDTYAELRRANAWTDCFLPNAAGAPPGSVADPAAPPRSDPFLALAARSGIIAWLGDREYRRCLKHDGRRTGGEAACLPDLYKGHFGDTRRRTLEAFCQRIERLGIGEESGTEETAGS